MANSIQKIKEEIKNLSNNGTELFYNPEGKTLGELSIAYESWYIKAYSIINQIAPERLQDFKDCYKVPGDKELDELTFSISDFLLGIRIGRTRRSIIDFLIGRNNLHHQKANMTYQSKLGKQIAVLQR